jgi:hypothetical protein
MACLVALPLISAAAEDDLDDNDDLKPTPEELARQAVLKRWPDATDIDVVDVAAEQDDADAEEGDNAADGADEADADDEHFEAEDKGDADDEAYWTLSVTFTSKDADYQALVDDDGRICYVYQEMELDGLPEKVLDAVHAAAEDAEVESVEKMTDETKDPAEELYVVGLAHQEMHIRPDGTVKKIVKFAARAEEDDGDHEDDPAEPEPEDAGDKHLL